jgi:hypothetical protein
MTIGINKNNIEAHMIVDNVVGLEINSGKFISADI